VAIVSIPIEALRNEESRDCRSAERHREWCLHLEAGDILLFPKTPLLISDDDLAFLRNRQQQAIKLQRNVFYKPEENQLASIDTQSLSPAAAVRLRAILRGYSQMATEFLRSFLAPYQVRWRLGCASFRPIEEQGRELPLHRRNDLLHTDFLPERPTHGARILRFFTNIHPTRTRDWITSDSFGSIVGTFAPKQIALPVPRSLASQALITLAVSLGLGQVLPSVKRSPYDAFMLRFNHFLKENSIYQASCPKLYTRFPAGSSWLVYSDTVPHAVLSGQFALEQTFLIDPDAQLDPASAPVAILERMTGARLR
jgi:3-deoxy-D-manno-oct-2-ulosonic acid (Kdo) hydroxylase